MRHLGMNTKKTSKVVVQHRVEWIDGDEMIIESSGVPFEKDGRTLYAVVSKDLTYIYAIEPRTGLEVATADKRREFGRETINIYSQDIKNLTKAITPERMMKLDTEIEKALKRYRYKELNKHLPR